MRSFGVLLLLLLVLLLLTPPTPPPPPTTTTTTTTTAAVTTIATITILNYCFKGISTHSYLQEPISKMISRSGDTKPTPARYDKRSYH